MKVCNVKDQCGGCCFQGVSYKKQLIQKQLKTEKLLSKFCKVEQIIGMEDPFHYRNKVHHVFDYNRKNGIISGCYKEKTHQVVDIENCLIEDVKSQQIIRTVKELCKSFKINIYNEDTGLGYLRHILVRHGFSSREIMIVLVVDNPIFPSKNNFIKALIKAHPEIKTIVLNINNKKTSMVLGEREIVIYGPGFIYDKLLDNSYRISAKSFFQVNPVQTEVLYQTVLDFANLSGKETVIDAYCGIGTISLTIAPKAKFVTGVELNCNAVKDAKLNARKNSISNVSFLCQDAEKYMYELAGNKKKVDCVIMDPPRTGSTELFMNSCIKLGPSKIIYVSCGLDTLVRDLSFFSSHGYIIERARPIDMFPFTAHVETVVLMSKVN